MRFRMLSALAQWMNRGRVKKKSHISRPDPVLARIWQGLKEGLILKEVSRRLQEEFEVEADRADRSVLVLVHELCQQRLVQGLD